MKSNDGGCVQGEIVGVLLPPTDFHLSPRPGVYRVNVEHFNYLDPIIIPGSPCTAPSG